MIVAGEYRRDRQSKAVRGRNDDPLTGLLNRQRFVTSLSSLLSAGDAEHQTGALLLLDIDSFAVTNEVFGHEAGDDLLRQVAAGLRRWADERCILGRTGGDEFGVALTGAAGEGFVEVASAVRAAVSAWCMPRVPQLSVGIATFDCRRPPTVDALLKRATRSLRESRQDDGGLIATYDLGATSGTDGAEWIVRALEEDRLTVFSQPIVDVSSNKVISRELLVRALDDEGQLVMPHAFIPAAERLGLMPAIDRWVVARGLALAADGIGVSINLSAQSLTDFAPLAALLESSIKSGSVDPANLMFEVTETTAISDLTVGYRALHTLSELGCALALDDFGVGFGCFSYLKHVPAQIVKIDREFIRDICRNRTDRAITVAIADLASKLGMETIAEGVEDQDTLSAVIAAGVRYAQGYLFGRPAPIAPNTSAGLPWRPRWE